MEITHARTKLLPPALVRGFSARSDAAGALRLAIHLVLLIGAGVLVWASLGTWWLLPAMMVQGIVQVALFAGLHECVHRTPFRNRLANDATAAAIGLVAVLPAGFFRRFHFAHHRFTQDPERDPEAPTAKPESWGQYLRYVSAWNYWRDRIGELFRHAAGRVSADFVPAGERAAVAREARWHLAVYALVGLAVAFGRPEPFVFWLGPALLGQPFLRLYLLAEHTGCPLGPDMLTNTRTTFTLWPLRLLMWNMPYHVEHHVYPAVPFHALPRLHRAMADRLVETAPGYMAFHRRYQAALGAGTGARFVRSEIQA